MAASSMKMQLPGFGLPLEQNSIIPTAPQNWYAQPITVRERAMIALMATLKDKPNWHGKVFNDEIVAKWKTEALQFGRTVTAAVLPPAREPQAPSNEEDEEGTSKYKSNGASIEFDGCERQKTISERMFEYCIAELRESAVSTRERGFTSVIDANACVYMSDTAITHDIKERLKTAMTPFEDIPDNHKDWHPGSDGKVLDLVHPSLYPLLYGRSKILPEGTVPLFSCHRYCGRGEVVPEVHALDSPELYPEKFQWLPCEVKLADDGAAKITSYINNLFPVGNENLYSAIEEVISRSVPLWIASLASVLHQSNDDRMEDFGDGYLKRLEDGEEIDGDAYESVDDEPIALPEPKAYGIRNRGSPTALDVTAATIHDIFLENGMQVIVKLANIHLTPEKPDYKGGSWHIEGQLNEHICASALYYYDEENITPSYLAFREGVDKDFLMDKAEQNREWGYCATYGIEDSWGDALQVLGKVLTCEDRLLAFPNVLQHRVSPFQLVDSTKPGHRKLLALFLVDPHIRIPSTANVPPQQAEWWARNAELDSVFGKFPNEVADQIIEDIDFPIGNEEAKRLREELIEDR